jgi:NDP-sugar pyrophosphorylase family protein
LSCRGSPVFSNDCFTLATAGVLVGEGARISSRAEIVGPALIGPCCEIRPHAYLRENVILGARCVIGNSTELKNCILFDSAQAPHFNYVGDSILGRRAHIGAGVILSNFKSDGSEVVVRGDAGICIPTGLVKFGAILGDDVEIGCNAVCNPGTVIGRRTTIYPLSLVRGVIPARIILKDDGETHPKRND